MYPADAYKYHAASSSEPLTSPARLSLSGSPDEHSLHLQTGMGINLFIFNEIIILFISVFLRCTACAKIEAYAFKLVVSGTVGCSVSTASNVSLPLKLA